MKRVLFVIPALTAGGAERVFLHLLRHLDRERFAPILAVGAADGAYLSLVPPDVPVHVLGARRARAAAPAIVRLVRRLKPDTVFSTLGMNLGVMMARPFFPRGTRVVLREGSSLSAFLADKARQSRISAAMIRTAVRLLYSRADRIICQSDFMLADLVATSGLAPDRMVRIHNPVDIAELEKSAASRAPVFEGPGPHLLSVGRLSFEKLLPVLVQAFARVVAEHPSATLTLVGDGPERANIEAAIAKERLGESVRLIGFEPNPAPFFARADLFVSSSLYEGFSNVVLEALALGTPVVVTDCPSGNREVVREGVNGWFARPNDVESLADTILRALRRPSLDRAALKRECADRFSVTAIARLYEREL